MKKILSVFTILFLFKSSVWASDQDILKFLQKENKMVAVNVVLMLILIGIFFFLFNQDRKIKRMEDQLKK